MKFSKFALSAGATLVSAAFLSACGGGSDGTGSGTGGGGGGGGTHTTISGGFAGKIADAAGDSFDMLLQDDLSFWVLYGVPDVNGVVNVSGFIHGTSEQNTTALTFGSTDAYDYGAALASPITGTYVDGASPSITGTITYSGTDAPAFSATPVATAQFDYAASPVLTDLAGTWDMGTLVGTGSKITVDATGATFRGVNDAQCTFTGTFTPDASLKNFFDVDITFEGGLCVQGTTEYKGITFLTQVGGATQLMLAGIDVLTQQLGISATGTVETGGGGGGGGGGQSAAGGFTGSINDPQGHQFDMLVLDDGTYWVMYGSATANGVNVTGFIHGTATEDTTAQTFSSSDALDFGFAPPELATVSGNYSVTGAGSIEGTIAYPDLGILPLFTGTSIPTGKYDYSVPANTADLLGTWNIAAFGGGGAQLQIAGDGSFTGHSSINCLFGGQFTADLSKNVFYSDITFQGGSCPQATNEYQGIAVVISSSTPQLVLAGINAATGQDGVQATGLFHP